MTRKQQRIYAILVVVLGIAVAAGLSLYALRDNVTFFYAPSDIVGAHPKQIDTTRPFRLGGLVMYGTIEKEGAITRFVVTDNNEDITVEYNGVAPALFAEGKGVVAMGRMRPDGIFAADQLLAKHDENYMPPEVARALEKNTKKWVLFRLRKGHPMNKNPSSPASDAQRSADRGSGIHGRRSDAAARYIGRMPACAGMTNR